MDPTKYARLALSRTIDEFHVAFTERNPLSRQLFQSSLHHLPGGNTRSVLHADPFPLVFDSAEGAMLTSVDGDTYIDFLNDYSAGLLGHSDPTVRKALQNALRQGLNFGGLNRPEKELARRIAQRFGEAGVDLIRFTNSGTEANTMALAAATQFTGRSKIVVFTGGNHGGTMSFPNKVPGSEPRAQDARGSMTANLPHEWVLAPFNNVEETRRIITDLGPNRVAAILVETVQGAGGCRPATKGFLTFLRQVATAQRAILIIDEVMTSRIGHAGHFASMGLKADLLTLGKYMGGGCSFGAFGGRADIMEIFNPLGGQGVKHAGTFNNNVLSMVGGNAALDVFTGAKLDELNALGLELKKELQSVLIHYGIYPKDMDPSHSIFEVDSYQGLDAVILLVGTEAEAAILGGGMPWIVVTGTGSLLNIRFNGPSSALWSGLLYHVMLANKVYLAPRGYMALSLKTTREHVALFVSLFERFLATFGPLVGKKRIF